MAEPNWPLEPSSAELEAMVSAALARAVAHLESLSDQPAAYREDATDLAASLAEPLPERGRPFDEILRTIFDVATPPTYNTASPGYLAFVPGGGIVHTAVADLIAATINRYTGVWHAAPALAQLESNVVRWFCDLVGFGAGSGGILTSGGSLAAFSAIVAARVDRLPEDFLDGVLYASDQVHHSVVKAARLAGFPGRCVHQLPSDEHFRLDVAALERAIAEDRAAGLTPFLVVASAGTTNTGAVDDLPAIATLAAREGLWLHVDAAYGGFFLLTERGRRRLAGIERADSVVLDPHKGLFLPYGTGSLVVREVGTLWRAHGGDASYMPPLQSEGERLDACSLSPELSKPFRGLRVWLPMALLGATAFRDALDEKLDLAERAAEGLRKLPGVVVDASPELSLLAFHLSRPGLSLAEENALNRRWLDAANRRQRVYLTGAEVGGRFLLRICVLSFRTHTERIEMALEDLEAGLAEV